MNVRVLATSVAITMVTALPVFLVGSLSVLIALDLGFRASEIGLAVTSYFIGSSVLSAPAGWLSERAGTRATMAAAAGASACALIGVALAVDDTPALYALMVIAGGGNAAANISVNTILAKAVPASMQGIAFGIKHAAIPASTLLAGLAIPVVGLTIGWRWAFGFTAIALAPMFLVARSTFSDVHGEQRRVPSFAGGKAPLLIAGMGAGLAAGAANGMAAFYIPAAVARGYELQVAGLLYALGSLFGIGARISNGWLADRRKGHHFLTIAVLLIAGGMALIALAAPLGTPALILATGVAFAAGWGWNGLLTHAVVRSNPHRAGAATGITQTGLFAGGVIGPLSFGLLVEAFSFSFAWVVAGVAMFLGAALVFAADHVLATAAVHAGDT